MSASDVKSKSGRRTQTARLRYCEDAALRPRYRRLRAGECIELEEIGVRGVFLAGTGVEIGEYKDGSCSVVLPRPDLLEQIRTVVFVELVSARCRTLDGADIRFLRRFLEWKQEGLAAALGVKRETVCRYETGKDPVPAAVSLAVQRLCLPGMIEALNAMPPELRNLNRRHYDRIQDLLAREHPEPVRLRSNFRVEIACIA